MMECMQTLHSCVFLFFCLFVCFKRRVDASMQHRMSMLSIVLRTNHDPVSMELIAQTKEFLRRQHQALHNGQRTASKDSSTEQKVSQFILWLCRTFIH